MNLINKFKCLISATIIAIVIISPLALKADDTIPLSFKEGDVISAAVMNSLLQRLSDVQKGITSSSDIAGTWNCTTATPTAAIPFGLDSNRCVVEGVLCVKSGLLTFDATTGNWYYSGGNSDNPYFDGVESCGLYFGDHGRFEVRSNRLILEVVTDNPHVSVYPLFFANPNMFRFDGPNKDIVECSRIQVQPAPPDGLEATVFGNSVKLTWIDQSSDENSFKVQWKTSANGEWETLGTTAQNETSYTDTGLPAGTYWYRVLATNDYGDSISSSVVQAIIP